MHGAPVKAASIAPFDGDALRRDLAALTRAHLRQPARLRTAALARVRTSFASARESIKRHVETGVMPGLAAARALSALQDETIAILYEFAARDFFPAAGAPESEGLAIIATGGYGRGLLAPYSDIDLLFLLPPKGTPSDEGVIAFVVQMLWDLGL